MRVALTGASGFIGSVLSRTLHEAGHTVTALVRAGSRRDHIEPWVDRFVVGPHDDDTCWPALLEDASCVIHNSVDWNAFKPSFDPAVYLRSNLDASLRLLWAAGDRQFIFMSSVAVHHDMRPRWQGRIDEDHPLRPATLYGAYKAAVEAHLWAAHFGRGRNCCALRPCAVYGIDPTLDRTIGAPIADALRAGKPYRRADGGKFVHVNDVAAAATRCVGNEAVAGRSFDLVDCYARWSDWARIAADILGVTAEIDDTSAAQPKNQFVTTAVTETLGVPLDRGHDGIRAHLEEYVRLT